MLSYPRVHGVAVVVGDGHLGGLVAEPVVDGDHDDTGPVGHLPCEVVGLGDLQVSV
jgi:hypothetical protein